MHKKKNYEVSILKAEDLPEDIINKLSFWSKPTLCKAYAKKDGVNLFYLSVLINNNIVAILPIFEKKKYGITYLVQPPELYYTMIDTFNMDCSTLYKKQNNNLMILQKIANHLKKYYFKVMLDLDPSIKDMRAFTWGGYQVSPRYTFTLKLNIYNSANSTKTMRDDLKKANESGLYAKECWDLNAVETLSRSIALRKKRSFRHCTNGFLDFLDELKELNICSKVVVYKDDLPIYFATYLKDISNSCIYALVSAANETGNKYFSSVFGLDFYFGNNNDFDLFDFTGANTEQVAFFKSKFNCDLVNYYRIHKKCMV